MTTQTGDSGVHLETEPLLAASHVTAGYGKTQVLSDVSLQVHPGEVVGILGHNGAGKTTLLKCLFRLLPLREGEVVFGGQSLSRRSSVETVRAGMSFTPSEKPIFRDLTVGQNLELGAHALRDRSDFRERLDEVLEIFPVLADRQQEIAGKFSGGQQRQLSLAIALMARPRLMLLDEPSLGISPAVVSKTFSTIRDLARGRGMSVLIVEQNVPAVTAIADRVYVLRNGSMVLEETGEQARGREVWWDLF
jgi:branched-chain amino acid transport system ATP-binding protein